MQFLMTLRKDKQTKQEINTLIIIKNLKRAEPVTDNWKNVNF